MQINVIWPEVAGLGSIMCAASLACEYVEFTPPDPDQPYTLVCDTNSGCHQSTVYCPIRFVFGYIVRIEHRTSF